MIMLKKIWLKFWKKFIKSSAIDKVLDTDILYCLVWWENKKINYKLLNNEECQDQDEDWYYMWCVWYANAHWTNINNYQTIYGWLVFDRMVKRWWASLLWGAYVIEWPKQALIDKRIIGYTRIKTLEECKQALTNKNTIQTWSKLINRKKTRQNKNIVVKWTSAWHSFIINWFDDKNKLLICKNSYGLDDFDKWLFYLKYEDFDLLFNSKYILHRMNEYLELINKYLKELKDCSLDSAYKVYNNKKYQENKKDFYCYRIAYEIRFIWKINSKELLEFKKEYNL